MKKSAIGLVLLISGLGIASAQAIPTQPQGPGQGAQAQGQTQVAAPVAKTLDGKLAFANDLPVLQTKDKAYNLVIPRFYYYAYTEGWKAGDSFHVDGYEIAAQPGQDKASFIVTKLVVGGKTFDFSSAFGHMGGRGRMGGQGYGQGYGPMMGDQGYGQGYSQGYGPMMGGQGQGRGHW